MIRRQSKRKRKSEHELSIFVSSVDVDSLKKDGDLLDRSDGQRVCQSIKNELLGLPKQSLLLIDLTRVERFGHSALKEVFAALSFLRTVALEGKYLIFRIDMNDHDVVDQIQILARDQGYVVPAIDMSGRWQVIGKLTKAERDTLRAVEESQEITSSELKQRLNLMTVAASNRLRALHGRGVISRVERGIPGRGGREFIYKPLICGKPGPMVFSALPPRPTQE
jgi:ribosomal protein S25